ncbi:Uncharacterised protein [Vibrio cholerae]|nr:Uncharacterised protein [Vibrio cholerae]CSD68354.1 Uncharacterised protein [Vibrio cholerae]
MQNVNSKQTLKAIYVTVSDVELLRFVNNCNRHLTVRQAVKLRLRIARMQYRNSQLN